MEKKICVLGLGYVGLPLAVAFAEQYAVVGFDVNRKRVNELKEGWDRTSELDAAQLSSVANQISYTDKISEAKTCDIYIVTVPTPIDETNRPDLTPIIDSSRAIGKVLDIGNYVIYESTVYPGVTEDICVPELERVSSLKFNEDFFCGYSPERINPGDKQRTIKKIMKVTSGSTHEAAIKIDELYKSIITAGTFPVSSIKVAEASKVIENTQRDVNIALINELALIFDQMDVDTNEVLEAAATKWNFIDLKPGLVGGHCIGVDPYYLTFKAEELGYKPNLILASRQINNSMGSFVAEKTIMAMIHADKKIKGSAILVLGLAFKENCPDIRNTKVVDVIEVLKGYGASVDVYDPWVKNSDESKWYTHGVVADPRCSNKKYEAIVVAVAHSEFEDYKQSDYESLSSGIPIVMDVKGVTPNPHWRL